MAGMRSCSCSKISGPSSGLHRDAGKDFRLLVENGAADGIWSERREHSQRRFWAMPSTCKSKIKSSRSSRVSKPYRLRHPGARRDRCARRPHPGCNRSRAGAGTKTCNPTPPMPITRLSPSTSTTRPLRIEIMFTGLPPSLIPVLSLYEFLGPRPGPSKQRFSSCADGKLRWPEHQRRRRGWDGLQIKQGAHHLLHLVLSAPP